MDHMTLMILKCAKQELWAVFQWAALYAAQLNKNHTGRVCQPTRPQGNRLVCLSSCHLAPQEEELLLHQADQNFL